MRSCLLLLALFLTLDCQSVWYRSLPEEKSIASRSYIGLWRKKTNPRSAINSSWHRNNWSEKIQFEEGGRFIKTYESEDLIGRSLKQIKIEGQGTYRVQKNWILLETKVINHIEKLDGEIKKKESNTVDSALLYYYYLDGNLIIPMIYDMGYREKDFGVKDGVSVPYDDKNFNFFRYIKIYAFKEFQSHAYYPEN